MRRKKNRSRGVMAGAGAGAGAGAVAGAGAGAGAGRDADADDDDDVDDPLMSDGDGASKTFGIAYGGTAKVRADDPVSEAIARFDVDAVMRCLRSASATSAHLHQVALRLVACVGLPTLAPERQRALIQITDLLLAAGASPRRGLWTALRYYRRFDHLRTILRFVHRLARASLRSKSSTKAGDTSLRHALEYAPRPGLPTTWTIVAEAQASRNNEMQRLAESVLSIAAKQGA